MTEIYIYMTKSCVLGDENRHTKGLRHRKKENKVKTRLYYIQYAHARCHQIFCKALEKRVDKILRLLWHCLS